VTNSLVAAESVLCARCSAELRPGISAFYCVTIEAVADPTTVVTDADMERDIRQEIRELLARMESLSEREAMDQVHRRLTLFLCSPCYFRWIENPTGSA
jgi:hypothetical protein